MSAPPWRAEPGARVGRWVLDGLIAHGGGARVWEAHRADAPHEIAAIKVLIGDGEDPALRAALAREAAALAALAHPGIVRLHEALLDHVPPALALERVRGQSTARWIRRPTVSEDRVMALVRQLVAALTAMHRAGVAHRDLKPEHVLIDDEGRAVLIDFGAASVPGGGDAVAPSTPAYAPPAWFLGDAGDGALHDAYALGVLLYEVLAGVRAPPGPVGGPRVTPLDPGPTVDPALRAIVRALTEPHAPDRLAVGRVLDRLPAPATATLPTLGAQGVPSSSGSVPIRVGRYLLEARCGQGAAGTVWRATDPQLDRPVAVKLLHDGGQAGGEAKRRFLREARAVARLAHPGIVRVLDVGVDGELPFLVMELVDGPSLAGRLAEGPLPTGEIARLGAVLAAALAHAHRAGIVHRDVKPSNILLRPDGAPLLTDFGVAREVSDGGTRLTVDGQVIGTPAYMAPEQARGDEAGPAADQYALGVVLYEALAGRRPTVGDHPAQVLHQVLSGALVPLRRAAPEAPTGLARVVERALALDPGDRYPDLEAMAADLQLLADDPATSIARLSLRVRARQALFRRRWPVGVAVLLALAVATTAGGAASVTAWRASAADAEREALAADRLHGATRRIDDLIEAGRIDEAEAAFDAFARLPEHQGTRALAQAWLAEGDRRGMRDGARAREAFARAWAAARHPDDQVDGLIRLGRAFQASHDWQHLSLVVRRLDERVGPDRADIADLRRDAALAVRDGAAALRATPDDRAAGLVVALLREATDTGWTHLSTVQPWPDGGLLVRSGARPPALAIVARAAALTVQQALPPLGDHSAAWPVGSDEDGRPLFLIGGRSGARHTLAALGEEGPIELLSWTGHPITSAVVARPDDGAPRIFATTTAYQRELLELVGAPDGWRITHPHPPTDATSSDLSQLHAIDLDGDGSDELLLVAGAWGAYDLRVLDAGADGSLFLKDRLRLGTVVATARERGPGPASVLALKRDKHPSELQFRDPPHHGEPEGLYRISWEEDRLRVTRRWPLPDGCLHVWSAELDGVPPAEVVVGCVPSSFVLAEHGGAWVAAPLADLTVVAALDLDGDGRDELVVNDQADAQRTWVLGAGAAQLPAQPVPAAAAPQILGTDPTVRHAWERAEDLAALGLQGPARAELEVLAALTPDLAGELLLRAGDLAEAQADLREALDLWAQAARDPRVADRGSQARVRLLLAMHRDDEAREVATSAREAAPPETRPRWDQQLASIAAPTGGVIRLGPASALEPAWRVGGPLAVRRTASTLDVAGAGGVLLARPVRWNGGPVTVRLRGTSRTLGYGGGIRIALRPLDDPDARELSLQVSAGGGGGVTTMRQACQIRDTQWVHPPNQAPWQAVPVYSLSDPLPIDARFDVRPDLLSGTCAWQRAGRRAVYRLLPPDWRAVPPYRPGVYALEVIAQSVGSADAPWVHLAVDELVVEGVEALPVPPPAPVDRVLHALADSRPDDALALVDQVAPASHAAFLRALALDDLGRSDDATRALLGSLRAGGVPDDWLVALVRARRGRYDGILSAELGDRWPPLMGRAWAGTLRHQPDDPALDASVLATLGELIDAAKPADPATHLALLRRRAIALRRAGRLDEARRHLERAIHLAGDASISPLAAELRRDLATVLLAANDTDAAMDALTAAVAHAPAPEVFADRLDADPTLDPLRRHPRWAPVVEAARRP